jgi:hypothetical protein
VPNVQELMDAFSTDVRPLLAERVGGGQAGWGA